LQEKAVSMVIKIAVLREQMRIFIL